MYNANLNKYHSLPPLRSAAVDNGNKLSGDIDPNKPTSTETVWTVFGDIAKETGASNLGQGFPDWNPPAFVLQGLQDVVHSPTHQYTRPAGHPPLVTKLAAQYSSYLDRKIDPMTEVAVTVGASQALFLALQVYSKPGDEVIIFEPFFDLYLKQMKLTGADAKFVKLGGPNAPEQDPWALDIDRLEAAITDKTRILILNSPHNPTGKVFTKKENEQIAALMRKHPKIMIFSDEVYKYSIYNALEEGDEGSKGHYHFARLPDMYDRTITLSSSGKTFSITGWQLGWMVGPESLIKPVQSLLPLVQFCPSTVMQQALANALPTADLPGYEGSEHNYYEYVRQQFGKKREILEEGLRAIGITPLPSQGGFFVMAQLPRLDISEYDHLDEPYDWKLCRKIAKLYNIIGIPASSFFTEGYDKEYGPLARFAMCKKDETLNEAKRRMIEGAKKHNA